MWEKDTWLCAEDTVCGGKAAGDVPELWLSDEFKVGYVRKVRSKMPPYERNRTGEFSGWRRIQEEWDLLGNKKPGCIRHAAVPAGHAHRDAAQAGGSWVWSSGPTCEQKGTLQLPVKSDIRSGGNAGGEGWALGHSASNVHRPREKRWRRGRRDRWSCSLIG